MKFKKGEAVAGFYKYEDGTDAVYVANHNAFAVQKMKLAFDEAKVKWRIRADIFDRQTGKWQKLKVKDKTVAFDLGSGGGELLRIRGRKEK